MALKNSFISKSKTEKNIQFSGLKGKALNVTMDDIPSKASIEKVVARKYFSPDTKTSIAYLLQTFTIQGIIITIGCNLPLRIDFLPVWLLYASVSGTTAMGFWVLAHECGHGAFSKNKGLETFIGYFLHSILLVPYYSWQRSHAIHHRFTNNISEGETHVPLVIEGNGITEQAGGEKDIAKYLRMGKNNYGMMQLALHLLIGWPAYLLAGKTGGPIYGRTNHFWPTAPFSAKLWPSKWAKKVWLSDFGILITIVILLIAIHTFSLLRVLGIYFAPLLVVNIWLVIYTWLHHTDSDVPHLAKSEFSYMRGAFLSIDRPYGKILDFLHHNIGSTHVIHHIAPSIPHYYAKEATNAIKNAFPKAYLFNPMPIHKALWHTATNCIAVKREDGSDRYVWHQPQN